MLFAVLAARMKTKNKKKFPVSSFDICLSNRCNLMCKYCYFDSINKGKAQFLKFEEIKKAVDIYVDFVSISGIDKISIAGGEPFIDYPLLLKVVKYIRSAIGFKTDIELFTNGTLSTPKMIRELFKYDVKIVVSIDGMKASNDVNRVFFAGDRSVFKTVFKNIGSLTKSELSRICVGMTVTAKTADKLVENIRFLREFGFGEVEINLNLMEMWSLKSLKNLSCSIKKLKKYYISLLSKEFKSYNNFRFGLEYVLLKWDEDLKESEVFKEISIAPDGYFYPCGIVSTYGRQKEKFRIGNLEKGLSVNKMTALRKTAVKLIRAGDLNCGLLEYIPNPMLLYFEALLKNIKLEKVFENSKKIFKIFYDELSVFLRMERMLDVLSSDAKFGDFQHEPVLKTNKEVAFLRLDLSKEKPKREIKACACGKGWVSLRGLSEMRQAADLMLYSNGADKTLVFNVSSVDMYFELIGALIVYALLKAEYLRKNLSVSIVFPAQKIMKDNIEFLKSNHVFLMPVSEKIGDIKFLKEQNLKYESLIIGLTRRNVRAMAEIYSAAADLGFGDIRFEATEDFPMNDSDEVLFKKNIREALKRVQENQAKNDNCTVCNIFDVFEKSDFKNCPFHNALRSDRRGGIYISAGKYLCGDNSKAMDARKSVKSFSAPYDKCFYSKNSDICANCARKMKTKHWKRDFIFEKNLKIEVLSVFSNLQKFELLKTAIKKNRLVQSSKLLGGGVI